MRVAKIVTLGEKVEDLFALVDQDNQPLSDEALLEKLREEIISALDEERD